jgi:hypothetical protein
MASILHLRHKRASRALSALLLTMALAVAQTTLSGVPDVEQLMGLPEGVHPVWKERPSGHRVGFFYADKYVPEMAVPADTVQLYVGAPTLAPDGTGPRSDWPEVFAGWRKQGYFVDVFLHSRYGSLIDENAPNVQTDRNGRQLTFFNVKQGGKIVDGSVGPISPDAEALMRERHHGEVQLERADRYEIPTLERIELAKKFYEKVLTDDVSGFCFDEPEIWANAGYSAAFQSEWKAHYGTPWEAPAGSVNARVKAERLKAFLVRRWVETILKDVKQRKPGISTMLALHSQPGYVDIGMGAPHMQLLTIPALDEVIAEVWNLPFDSAFLQYSSFENQLRGSGKKLWLMMDPWGDSPALTYDYYHARYADNLVAALMFPGEDRFQPQIWPNRLYGHIPKDYEVVINTAAGAVGDLRRYGDGYLDCGSFTVGTFTSDTMSWQRSDPSPSDFDGFYGLSLPLLERGIPVSVLALERAAEPGYLDSTRCLIVSYDFLKPSDAAQNRAFAEWTRKGGALILVGGSDPYNAAADTWWSQAGWASPLEELLSELGIAAGSPKLLSGPGNLRIAPSSDLKGSAPMDLPLGPTPGSEQNRRRVNLWAIETDNPVSNGTYPVTLYGLPDGAHPLVAADATLPPIVWEKRVGEGIVVFAGISPGAFRANPNGPAFLRALAHRAVSQVGGTLAERPLLVSRRGPYWALRTENSPQVVQGRFVDLLSPKLAVLEDPELPAATSAFFYAFPHGQGSGSEPVVSGLLRAHADCPSVTSFLVSAPTGTMGAARVFAFGRRPSAVTAFGADGAPVKVDVSDEKQTLLLTYPNSASGVIIRVKWDVPTQ